MSDTEIIESVLSGNTSSYAALVERHKSLAFTMAYRFLKNREDAEEIVQDAFVKAFSNLRQFRKESKFSTWLYRIVFNLCATAARKHKPDVFSFEDEMMAEPEDETMQDILSQLERKDNRRIIRDALMQLNGEDAAIVTMYYYEDSSVEEISNITGQTESNIKVKLFRSRKKLFALLEKEFRKEGIEVRG